MKPPPVPQNLANRRGASAGTRRAASAALTREGSPQASTMEVARGAMRVVENTTDEVESQDLGPPAAVSLRCHAGGDDDDDDEIITQQNTLADNPFNDELEPDQTTLTQMGFIEAQQAPPPRWQIQNFPSPRGTNYPAYPAAIAIENDEVNNAPIPLNQRLSAPPAPYRQTSIMPQSSQSRAQSIDTQATYDPDVPIGSYELHKRISIGKPTSIDWSSIELTPVGGLSIENILHIQETMRVKALELANERGLGTITALSFSGVPGSSKKLPNKQTPFSTGKEEIKKTWPVLEKRVQDCNIRATRVL